MIISIAMIDDLLLFDNQLTYLSKLFLQYLWIMIFFFFFLWKRVGFDLESKLSISVLLQIDAVFSYKRPV